MGFSEFWAQRNSPQDTDTRPPCCNEGILADFQVLGMSRRLGVHDPHLPRTSRLVRLL